MPLSSSPSDETEFSAAEQEPAEQPRKPEKTSTKRPGKPPSDLDAPISSEHVKHALYRVFSVAARFPFRSSATFEESEFIESANDLVLLVNKVAVLRIVFNVIAPIIGGFGLVEKVQRIKDGMPKKPPKTSNGTEPLYGQGTGTEGAHVA